MFDNRIDYMEETRKQIRESAETFRKFERADRNKVKDWDVSLGWTAIQAVSNGKSTFSILRARGAGFRLSDRPVPMTNGTGKK